MNGEVAGSELPELSDEDVQILDAICKSAAQSQKRPSAAIFDSYDAVLGEQGLEGRHDPTLFRWIIRITEPRADRRGPIDFVGELRSLLAAHGITVVDDSDVEVVEEQHVSVRPRKRTDNRRVSFDDAHYEETWLSNHTQTFPNLTQSLEYSHPSARERSRRYIQHARSLSRDRADSALPLRQPLSETRAIDQQPPLEELDEAAEAFLDTTTVRCTRRLLRQWFQATDALLFRKHKNEILAAQYDYRTLLRLSWNFWREQYNVRRLEKYYIEKEVEVDNLVLVTTKKNALVHLLSAKNDMAALQAVARRHMLRFRYFIKWRTYILESQALMDKWRIQRHWRQWLTHVNQRRLDVQCAEMHYENAIVKQHFRHWTYRSREQHGARNHEGDLNHNAIHSLRRRLIKVQAMDGHAILADRLRRLRLAFATILHGYEHIQSHKVMATQQNVHHLKSLAMHSITPHAILIPKLHQQQKTFNKVRQHRVITNWHYCSQQQLTAKAWHNERVSRKMLTSWNDTLRVVVIQERINTRVQIELLYRMLLEERARLCSRMLQVNLLQRCWNVLLRSSSRLVNSEERRLVHFTRESRRRKLATFIQRMHLKVRRRDDATRAAIEFRNARLLPRSWRKLKQQHEHAQELSKWSVDAAFFVVTKKTLTVWHAQCEKSKHEKRRIAYETVRNKIKTRLIITAWTALGRQLGTVTVNGHEALRLCHDNLGRQAARICSHCNQTGQEINANHFRATQHYQRSLCQSVLSILIRSHQHYQALDDIAMSIKDDLDSTLRLTILKRLKFAAFSITRLNDNSSIAHARSQNRHISQMLRHLAIVAAERRMSREHEPESPSLRPASRAASRSDSQSSSRVDMTPAYLRTPSRARRSRYRPIPTPTPLTPFTFTPGDISTTPAPISNVEPTQSFTPQITPFNRRLRASGVTTDLRPASILKSRPFGRSIGPGIIGGTGKSVRFTAGSRFQKQDRSFEI